MFRCYNDGSVLGSGTALEQGWCCMISEDLCRDHRIYLKPIDYHVSLYTVQYYEQQTRPLITESNALQHT